MTQNTMCSAGSLASAYIADFSLSASHLVNAPPPVACVVASSALSRTKSSISSDPSPAPMSATIVSFAAGMLAAPERLPQASGCSWKPRIVRAKRRTVQVDSCLLVLISIRICVYVSKSLLLRLYSERRCTGIGGAGAKGTGWSRSSGGRGRGAFVSVRCIAHSRRRALPDSVDGECCRAWPAARFGAGRRTR
jgi:hypothetical protein